jgi:hypothetical protein
MAAKEPRHPLDKRELLHREPADAARIDAIAKKLIDEGRCGESIEYVEVTRNAQLIPTAPTTSPSSRSASSSDFVLTTCRAACVCGIGRASPVETA